MTSMMMRYTSTIRIPLLFSFQKRALCKQRSRCGCINWKPGDLARRTAEVRKERWTASTSSRSRWPCWRSKHWTSKHLPRPDVAVGGAPCGLRPVSVGFVVFVVCFVMF